jgi:hypothetical protein
MPLANTDREPPGNRTPNLSNTQEPKLPAIHGGRASLSQSLRPAAPPDEGRGGLASRRRLSRRRQSKRGEKGRARLPIDHPPCIHIFTLDKSLTFFFGTEWVLS